MSMNFIVLARTGLCVLLALSVWRCGRTAPVDAPSFGFETEEDVVFVNDALQPSDTGRDDDASPDVTAVQPDASLSGDDSVGGDTDPEPLPSVRVTAPATGAHRLGVPLLVAWTPESEGLAMLDLVDAGQCRAAPSGTVLEDLGAGEASGTNHTWDVSDELANGDYRVRVTLVTSTGELFGCSDVFSLAEPGDLPNGESCETSLDCGAGAWCSTVEPSQRCAPQAFQGTPVQMDFVLVPRGTFEQGTPGDTGLERPYTATLTRDYFVSRTEITQGQWTRLTDGANPSFFQDPLCTWASCSLIENANPNAPVEGVSWLSAVAYANQLSEVEGLQPCYTFFPESCLTQPDVWGFDDGTGCAGATFSGLDCQGYRLLTESEWERAARGGTQTTNYWGDDLSTVTVDRYAWTTPNNNFQTRAVATLLPNAYGLYDMMGNVYEWTWDSGSPTRAGRYPVGAATDNLGLPGSGYRVRRGGYWMNYPSSMSASTRVIEASDPDNLGDVGTGFRLARTATPL